MRDGIQVLHIIDSDDTNIAVKDLRKFLEQNYYKLGVIGLLKTVDSDVYLIVHSLEPITPAYEGDGF
jgi:6-phosphofructokinase